VAACAKLARTALAVSLLSQPAWSASAHPSFPCTGVLTPTETAICSDDNLAALDRALDTAYRNKFDGLPVESADALDDVVKSLVITQKAWLAHRDSCDIDRVCIYKAYLVRKRALIAGDAVKDTPCRDTVGAEQAAIYVKECIALASETHPPCNADNSCEPIISHNILRCTGLGVAAPKFCGAYLKPSN
jgi:uncharacterized protein YecT (DUF1311 family)